MKLIREEIEAVEVITESRGGKKTLYIKGPFLQTETVNRNQRVYRLPVMQKEVKRYTESYIRKGRALGELGHPEGPTVNLDRVSHKIVSLEQKGNNFIGKAQILSTPMGNIAKSLLGEGVKLGSRTPGMVEEGLKSAVGWPMAKELLFTGRVIEAEESYRIGLLNHLNFA